MIDVGVLRIRKGRPGVGKRIAGLFSGLNSEVTCNNRPAQKIARDGIIINYGRSERPIWWRDDLTIINHWAAVGNSSNKLKTLQLLEDAGVPTLEWSTDPNKANTWWNQGARTFVRHTLNGQKGKGIQILEPYPADNGVPIPRAPLYTKAYDKKHEFRVFVAGGQVIDLVQKKKMSKEAFAKKGRVDEIDMDLRNYRRGWVFAHEDLAIGPKGRKYIKGISLRAMEAVGLDYGAVDVLYKSHDDMVVCEVNSAPAMRGKTTWAAFKKYFLEVTRA